MNDLEAYMSDLAGKREGEEKASLERTSAFLKEMQKDL